MTLSCQKTKTLRLRVAGQLRDNHHFAQFEGECRDLITEVREIVAIAFGDTFNQAMHPQAFKPARDLADGLIGQLGRKAWLENP